MFVQIPLRISQRAHDRLRLILTLSIPDRNSSVGNEGLDTKASCYKYAASEFAIFRHSDHQMILVGLLAQLPCLCCFILSLNRLALGQEVVRAVSPSRS